MYVHINLGTFELALTLFDWSLVATYFMPAYVHTFELALTLFDWSSVATYFMPVGIAYG